MSDDEEQLLLPGARREREGDLVLYDHFKHLTTLALLMLGGILSLSQSEAAKKLEQAPLVASVVLVATGGVFAFSGAGEIARAHFHGTAAKRLELYRRLSVAGISVGIGMFLALFLGIVGK